PTLGSRCVATVNHNRIVRPSPAVPICRPRAAPRAGGRGSGMGRRSAGTPARVPNRSPWLAAWHAAATDGTDRSGGFVRMQRCRRSAGLLLIVLATACGSGVDAPPPDAADLRATDGQPAPAPAGQPVE